MNALASTRTFVDRDAVREQVPLLIGLVGPSGSGKTYSALRIASGIRRVTGGDIFVIDTEARRALHYAGEGPGKFKFRHVEFGAPFGSLDYLAAIRHCAEQRAGVIVVDSMSHEHEGPGGLIDAHETELTRMAGNDYAKRERMQMLAWQKPKAARRALLNGIVQLGVSCIMCFRAGEKTKPMKDPKDGKLKPVEMGFTPIAGPEFVYEMTLSLILYPRSDGVPTLRSELPGENIAIKVPGQFRELLGDRDPLSEDLGEKLARWAGGGAVASPRAASVDLAAILAEGNQAAERGSVALQAWWKRLTSAEKLAAKPSLEKDLKPLAAAVDRAAAEDEPDFGDMPEPGRPDPGLAGLAMKTGAQLKAEQDAAREASGAAEDGQGPDTAADPENAAQDADFEPAGASDFPGDRPTTSQAEQGPEGLQTPPDARGPEYLFEDAAEFASAAPVYIEQVRSPKELNELWVQWKAERIRLKKADPKAYQALDQLALRRSKELEAEANG